jgi:hypothetical protein
MPAAIGAVVETTLVVTHQDVFAPGTGFVVAAAIASYYKGRISKGGEIIRRAFGRAGATTDDFPVEEELAAGCMRYGRAIRDQAADENLRILAEAMIGLAGRDTLWASDFLKFADIIAPLSRDELILIGALMDQDRKFAASTELDTSGAQIWLWVIEALEDIFPDGDLVSAIAARSQRSGLVIPLSVVGGTAYALSPIGKEVRDVVDIEAALGVD